MFRALYVAVDIAKVHIISCEFHTIVSSFNLAKKKGGDANGWLE